MEQVADASRGIHFPTEEKRRSWKISRDHLGLNYSNPPAELEYKRGTPPTFDKVFKALETYPSVIN